MIILTHFGSNFKNIKQKEVLHVLYAGGDFGQLW